MNILAIRIAGAIAALAAAITAPSADAATAAKARKPASPASATAPLPDSVVVRFPHRDLTLLDVQTAWYRQAQVYRPRGSGIELRRTFVDQLIEREVLAQAALAEPFVATEPESARYLTERAQLLALGLYSKLVYDSLQITDEDWRNARLALTGGMEVPDSALVDTIGLAQEAKQSAARRRSDVVSVQISNDLAPVWDDSVAALLAREFAKLPPLRQERSGDVVLRVTNKVPEFAPPDTGRVLVSAKGDRITVGAFLLRFQGIPPTQREYPVTPGEVKARAEQFLGGAWLLREAIARGYERDPAIVRSLAERREGFALDHWYARHVATAVDTSEAKLRAFFEQDPKQFAIPPHRLIHSTLLPDSMAADSLKQKLDAGLRWEDWCAARFEPGVPRDGCVNQRTVFDSDADSANVRRLAAFRPGQTWARMIQLGLGRAYEVGQLVERVEGRLRTFEEARPFVVRSLGNDQVERRLQSLIQELRAKTPVRWNEAALARLDLGPEAGGTKGGQTP